jgi:hypothetical protein
MQAAGVPAMNAARKLCRPLERPSPNGRQSRSVKPWTPIRRSALQTLHTSIGRRRVASEPEADQEAGVIGHLTHDRSGSDRIHQSGVAYASAKQVDSHLRVLLLCDAIHRKKAMNALNLFDQARATTRSE